MNGAPTPASPSAPTPFKKSRRPILFAGLSCPVGNGKPADVREKLVFDPGRITEECFSFAFMARFSPFPTHGKTNLPFIFLRLRIGT